MARNSTAIPVAGDRNYVRAVKAVAYSLDYDSASEFVRAALDAFAGDQLKAQEASFAAKRDTKNSQSLTTNIITDPTTEHSN